MKSLRFVSRLTVDSLPDPAIGRTIGMTLGSLLLAILLASVCSAQQRTFVSGLGFDTNPCTRTAPCRTFGQAISMTNPGGEVIVLDSSGYGPVAITQAVSLIAPPGVYAGISVFSGDGINITAGSSDTIVLSGLTINNQGSSGNGIVFSNGNTLHVESCVINGFSGNNGLAFLGAGSLEVKDSIFRGNESGILVAPSSGTATATIDHARLEGATNGSGSGVVAFPGSKVTVSNTLTAGFHIGFLAEAATSGAEINLENCTASGNNFGVTADSLSTGIGLARVSNSTITDNAAGLANNGAPAVLLSRTNNTVEGNTTNTIGSITSYTAK